MRQILISNRCDGLLISPAALRKALRLLDKHPAFSPPSGDISLVFLDDTTMTDLHATFLGDPTPTDVITFPGAIEHDEGGEICVGAEQAYHQHEKMRQSYSCELMLYIVHGWLHLCGYNDKNDGERVKMRAAEESALSHILENIPIPHAKLNFNRPSSKGL